MSPGGAVTSCTYSAKPIIVYILYASSLQLEKHAIVFFCLFYYTTNYFTDYGSIRFVIK